MKMAGEVVLHASVRQNLKITRSGLMRDIEVLIRFICIFQDQGICWKIIIHLTRFSTAVFNSASSHNPLLASSSITFWDAG